MNAATIRNSRILFSMSATSRRKPSEINGMPNILWLSLLFAQGIPYRGSTLSAFRAGAGGKRRRPRQIPAPIGAGRDRPTNRPRVEALLRDPGESSSGRRCCQPHDARPAHESARQDEQTKTHSREGFPGNGLVVDPAMPPTPWSKRDERLVEKCVYKCGRSKGEPFGSIQRGGPRAHSFSIRSSLSALTLQNGPRRGCHVGWGRCL